MNCSMVLLDDGGGVMMKNLVFASAVSLAALAAGSVQASTCMPATGEGAWITAIDGTSVDPCIGAN
jgi:hypothetical protein